MKKLYFLGSLLLLFLLMPIHSYAFEQGYERKTEAIYATVRYDLAIYEDTDWDLISYLPEYQGIKAWQESNSWYYVEYEKDGETHSGYCSSDDFHSDCLIYDGREKQIIADGAYQLKYVEKNTSALTFPSIKTDLSLTDSFHCTFIYVGNDLFKIMNTDSGEYLQPDPLFSSESAGFWGPEDTAGAFKLTHSTNYFSIKDSVTHRYLSKNEEGVIYFKSGKDVCWSIRRYDKAIDDDSLRVFAQFDAEWADYYYGPGTNDDPSSNVFTTSACGIFATVNAIYSLTGMYANPYDLADFAVENNYRILDNGTDNGIFEAAANKFGEKYNFSYDGSSGSIEELKEKLKEGDVAICHVPGHYTAIVNYSDKQEKYLLLDPHYLPKRATYAYGDWISTSDLEEGELMAQEFYFYKAIRPNE